MALAGLSNLKLLLDLNLVDSTAVRLRHRSEQVLPGVTLIDKVQSKTGNGRLEPIEESVSADNNGRLYERALCGVGRIVPE